MSEQEWKRLQLSNRIQTEPTVANARAAIKAVFTRKPIVLTMQLSFWYRDINDGLDIARMSVDILKDG